MPPRRITVNSPKPPVRPSQKRAALPIDQCHDLQIFIDRAPSAAPSSPEVADQDEWPITARDGESRDIIPTAEPRERQKVSVTASRYITIANSEVVEAF